MFSLCGKSEEAMTADIVRSYNTVHVEGVCIDSRTAEIFFQASWRQMARQFYEGGAVCLM